jgi:large subunit ribosomal protein L21
MYAVVRLAGKQVRVEPDMNVQVPRLDAEIGSVIQCDDVLLFSDGEDIRVGQPKLDDVKVTAEVLEHGRDRKVIIFKMKRRKNYRRKKGHRQGYTLLRIKEVSA